MNTSKALISKEKELGERIKKLRKEILKREKILEDTVERYITFEMSIKSFYKNYYLVKLGNYISVLEGLKNKILGVKDFNRNENLEVSKETIEDVDEKKLKILYRKLAKIYHPDNIHSEDDKEFYKVRMSEVNRAFEKRDIKELERLLKKAYIELGIGEYSSLERIKYMEEDIYIITKMTEIYQEKIKILEGNEIAKLMKKDPKEREEIIEKLKERMLSEIDMYYKICVKLGYS
jgi:hypothetical protein